MGEKKSHKIPWREKDFIEMERMVRKVIKIGEGITVPVLVERLYGIGARRSLSYLWIFKFVKEGLLLIEKNEHGDSLVFPRYKLNPPLLTKHLNLFNNRRRKVSYHD